MVTRRVRAPRIDFGDLRRELKLPEQFPPAAQREAEQMAGRPLPDTDRTDIPLVTIDPASSLDLDQALCLRPGPGGDGYRVFYAIADVAAYVPPGGELEAETWRRGQTVYLPDGNVPLHPHELSEGAVSLLPGADRAAVVWTIDLSADGETTGVRLERARVRSRAKLSYAGVQADVDAGRLAEPIALLPEVGRLLIERGRARGAINLPMPEQEVEPTEGGDWTLVLRAPLAVEEYNAQISLLTGMAAAKLMLDGGLGLLRTMPAPRPDGVAKLHTAAASLGVAWPDGDSVGEVIAALDPARPGHAAFLDQAAELMRGAGYTAFDRAAPADPGDGARDQAAGNLEHGGVAAPYAHVTAPLRRLADRYATEAVLALHEGRPVPDWVRAALPKLPEVMRSTDRVASAAARGAVELAEAVLLSGRIGETFPAAVLDVDAGRDKEPRGVVALDDPPVQARCTGELPLGERVRVRLTEADPSRRHVLFELA